MAGNLGTGISSSTHGSAALRGKEVAVLAGVHDGFEISWEIPAGIEAHSSYNK